MAVEGPRKSLLRGELKIGTLFTFLQLASGFLSAAFGVVGTYLSLVVLRPQLVKAQEILAIDPEPPTKIGAASSADGIVVMDDVWFRYTPMGPWILREYQLRVELGERHTIRGPSGSGKSTIMRLVAGLYMPERGTIRVGGLTPQDARSSILFLPQNVQLYGGSILDNLRVISGGASREGLMDAARRTGLQPFVQTLPMQFDTLLPHGANSLSGGQRQLIALTAALASQRSLLLLDEPLANLDNLWATTLDRVLSQCSSTRIMAGHG